MYPYYYVMMSENNAQEFVTLKEYFSSLGYEVIGSKEINSDTIYLIKEIKKE